MSGALVAGLLAGLGIAMPVGAVATYLVAVTARTDLRTGACAALGVATADGLYALIAVAGGAALVPVLQPFLVPLRIASAVVLVALAVRGAATAIARYRARGPAGPASEETPLGPLRAYLGFLGITIMNPLTVVYFAALVIGGPSGSLTGPVNRSVFVAAAFAASAAWQLLLASGGALLGRSLTGSRGRLATATASSTLIVVLAVHLLVTAA
ncbi:MULTISPECIES: LysE family transporter [Streptomyces]|uniref:LysE family transporter n=1 Tax=Streptomyces solicathayae TaxID=3081768 RepID=A0ABZ0LN43_9ACTN|nr:LysE family transporter [Streptomyces sp. HUAS YS2]WOX20234.1 LysE family transporter [Streptomyces sp. HUAS YS2]